MEHYNIDGHVDLARDPATGAIVNVNSLDYTHYTISRNSKKSKNERVDSMAVSYTHLTLPTIYSV